MMANLARFFAWQNLLLLPLVIMAVHVGRSKRELLVWAMLAAMVLTPLAMLVLRKRCPAPTYRPNLGGGVMASHEGSF